MSRQVMDGVIIAAALALGAGHLYAQGFAGRTVIHADQAGGVTGSALRVKGPGGEQGTASRSGSLSRGTDGAVSGSRQTNAQANSGANYQGATSYEKGSGVTHGGTCTNAAPGDVVPCTEFTTESTEATEGLSVTLCDPLW